MIQAYDMVGTFTDQDSGIIPFTKFQKHKGVPVHADSYAA